MCCEKIAMMGMTYNKTSDLEDLGGLVQIPIFKYPFVQDKLNTRL